MTCWVAGLDPSGQRTWVGLLQGGTHDEDIIGGIVASDEYWGRASGPPSGTGFELSGGGVTTAGVPVSFTASGAFRSVPRDVTAETTLTITGGTCVRNVCAATGVGDHTVTATWGAFTRTAPLHVDHGPATGTHLVFTGLASPGGGDIPAGASTAVTVLAADAYANPFDLTGSMTVTLDGTPCATLCGPFTAGKHTVTAVPVPGSGLPAPAAATVVGKNPTTAGGDLPRRPRTRRLGRPGADPTNRSGPGGGTRRGGPRSPPRSRTPWHVVGRLAVGLG